ncbi:MAG: hypothetical protein KDK36_02485, partial [Leptospiraceae bacterium]|nr:hypothetical protein [Leptospiraceae bacterium]
KTDNTIDNALLYFIATSSSRNSVSQTNSSTTPTIESTTVTSGYYALYSVLAVMSGGKLLIKGSGFPEDKNLISAKVNSEELTILSSKNTEIEILIPDTINSSSGTLMLTINGKSYSGKSLILLKKSSLTISNRYQLDNLNSISILTNSGIYLTTLSPGTYNFTSFGGSSSIYPDIYIYKGFKATGDNQVASSTVNDSKGDSVKFTITEQDSYVIETRVSSGSGSLYNILLNSSLPTSSFSCNVITGKSFCMDGFSHNVNFSSATCDTIANPSTGTNNSSTNCESSNGTGNIVGKCLIPYVDVGPMVKVYYSSGGAAFNSTTASTDCSSHSKSIFIN